MEREMQAQMEREMQAQIEEEMRVQTQSQSQTKPPTLPPRPKRFDVVADVNADANSFPRKVENADIDVESNSNKAQEKGGKSLDPSIHASISKIRSAHAHHSSHSDNESEDEDNEAMSEIQLSKIPIQRLDIDDVNLNGFEEMSEINLPSQSFGTLAQRFEAKWEMEDEALHAERKVWRRRFRGVLGEFMRKREVRI